MTQKASFDFAYFPDYLKWAKFVSDDCDCPDGSPCLEGVYFGDPDIEDPVCLSDLVAGSIRVDIPDYLVDELRKSVKKVNPKWSKKQIDDRVEQAVDSLSRTPAVPWIQENEWPVHCGDFCRYLGEWDQARLTEAAPDGKGLAFLWSILPSAAQARRDRDELWEELGNEWAAVYVFECLTCGRLMAVEQSY